MRGELKFQQIRKKRKEFGLLFSKVVSASASDTHINLRTPVIPYIVEIQDIYLIVLTIRRLWSKEIKLTKQVSWRMKLINKAKAAYNANDWTQGILDKAPENNSKISFERFFHFSFDTLTTLRN